MSTVLAEVEKKMVYEKKEQLSAVHSIVLILHKTED